jgi:hypothetical protein
VKNLQKNLVKYIFYLFLDINFQKQQKLKDMIEKEMDKYKENH